MVRDEQRQALGMTRAGQRARKTIGAQMRPVFFGAVRPKRQKPHWPKASTENAPAKEGEKLPGESQRRYWARLEAREKWGSEK